MLRQTRSYAVCGFGLPATTDAIARARVQRMRIERLHHLLTCRPRKRPEFRRRISIQGRHAGRDVQPKILDYICEKPSHVDRRKALKSLLTGQREEECGQ